MSDASTVLAAADALRDGELVAFPTETVYGLGADAANPLALRHLFAVKGRPSDHPVIAHLADADALDAVALEVPDPARRLVEALWPGPLTIVVSRRPGAIADEVTGGRPTVAVRVPDHPVALALLRAFGGPIAAPSANRFGRVSPTTAADVRADLGDDVSVVLDGGPSTIGVESTIVDVTGAEVRVLRIGGVSEERLAHVLGAAPVRRTEGEIAAPGARRSHYAPDAHVEVAEADELEARIATWHGRGARVGVLGAEAPAGTVSLSRPESAREYARVLYAALRRADREGLDVVIAVPPDPGGLGAAVVDRLRRAAAR